MKKNLCFFFLVVLVFTLVSCSSKNEPSSKGSSTTEVTTVTNEDGSETTTTTTTNSDGSKSEVSNTTHANYTVETTKVIASDGTYTSDSLKANTNGTKEKTQENKLADGSIAKIVINIAANGTPSLGNLTHKTSSGSNLANENITGNWKMEIYMNNRVEQETFYDIDTTKMNPFDEGQGLPYQIAGKTVYFEFVFTDDDDDDDILGIIPFIGFKQNNGAINGKYQCYSIQPSFCENAGISNDIITLEPITPKTIATGNIVIDGSFTDWNSVSPTYTAPSGNVLNPDTDLIEVKIAKKSDNSELYVLLKVKNTIDDYYCLHVDGPGFSTDFHFDYDNNENKWNFDSHFSGFYELSGEAVHSGQYIEMKITGISNIEFFPKNFILLNRTYDVDTYYEDKLISSILKF